ncbi:hypothetical protein BJX68DRAFT_257743 [Aspergillus pseudodeflectus]|uniref:Transcription factor domain-containing protein n=1 Tax=Aspergillus pseudodeflectus TaxID=176178 RepID=A0ABR4JQX5_9EURO
MPPPTLTFIHGPTIRTGCNDASLVRSQLMRKQHQEKRHRIQLPKTNLHHALPLLLPLPEQSIHDMQAASWLNLHQIAPGQVDPFFPDDRKTTPNFDFLLRECVNVVFPTARPGEFANRSLQAYLHPDRSPMVMQSMLYSALLHLHVLPILRGIPSSVAAELAGSYTIQRLRIKGAVMNQVRQRLLQVDSTNIHQDQVEDVVMSVLYLASNEHLESIRRPERGPFSPPFRTLQSMEYYGSCEVHPLHWQTVQHIIEQRGGIHTLKLYGLGWLVSVSGVISAINTDCKPPFPIVYPDGKPVIYRAPLQALGIQQPPRHATLRSHGFQQLALLHPPVKGTIIRVLLDLSEMAQALNHLAGDRCGDRLLILIGDIRVTVVHRLCSLPNERAHPRPTLIFHKRDCTPEQQLQTATTIFFVARKSALLYTVNVVLPLPQTSLLRRKMTLSIQEYMLQLPCDPKEKTRRSRPPAELEILLWCAVVAGICADSTFYPDTRAWFVAQARSFCRRLGISSWEEELLVLLQSFCWLDSASDEAGRAFWSEMGSSA